jgi:hypothetical protein
MLDRTNPGSKLGLHPIAKARKEAYCAVCEENKTQEWKNIYDDQK